MALFNSYTFYLASVNLENVNKNNSQSHSSNIVSTYLPNMQFAIILSQLQLLSVKLWLRMVSGHTTKLYL